MKRHKHHSMMILTQNHLTMKLISWNNLVSMEPISKSSRLQDFAQYSQYLCGKLISNSVNNLVPRKIC